MIAGLYNNPMDDIEQPSINRDAVEVTLYGDLLSNLDGNVPDEWLEEAYRVVNAIEDGEMEIAYQVYSINPLGEVIVEGELDDKDAADHLLSVVDGSHGWDWDYGIKAVAKPIDDDSDRDGDGADVDLLARVGLLGSDKNDTGFEPVEDDDLPF